MAIFVPGLKSSMSRCTRGKSFTGPGWLLMRVPHSLIQLVSTYVGSHSDRGACTRAATTAAELLFSVMRTPPP